MILINAPSPTQAIDLMTRRAYFSTGLDDPLFPVHRVGTRLLAHDVVAEVTSLLEEPFPLGYNYKNVEGRWKSFCTRYLPSGDEILRWLHSCHTEAYTWGEFPLHFLSDDRHHIAGCLSFLAFRSKPTPTLTLVSRAMKLFPMGTLDMALMTLFAKELAQTWGSVGLRWYIPSFQFDPSLAIAYLRGMGYTDQYSKYARTVTRGERGTKRQEILRAYLVSERIRAEGLKPWWPEGIWLSKKEHLPLPLPPSYGLEGEVAVEDDDEA